MRRHRAWSGLALLLATSGLLRAEAPQGPRPESVGISADRLRRLGLAMRDAIEAKKMVGCVTLVARGGRVVHLEATGDADREAKRPMRTDTIFRMASMSKAVTSVAVMMLVEEGRIALSDPVSRFIPAFQKTTVAVALRAEPCREARRAWCLRSGPSPSVTS